MILLSDFDLMLSMLDVWDTDNFAKAKEQAIGSMYMLISHFLNDFVH